MPNELIEPAVIALAVAMVAALYASVGHGGASGYLAVMALLSVSADVMKPGALALNLLVAGIGAIQYFRAGHFRFRLLWPFVLSSIPMSYLGARLPISPKTYGLILSATLVWAGVRLAITPRETSGGPKMRPLPPLGVTLAAGALIGIISGMVGVGGGIFLSPLFIFMRWGNTKETAAVSAAFIWLNSAAGLLGHAHTAVWWPTGWIVWAAAAAFGGVLGSYWGSKKLSNVALLRILAVVLLIAAGKSALVAATAQPGLKIKQVSAEEVQSVIRSYQGKAAVVVNVWATWCVPCVEEFPHLVELQRRHADRLRVILISADFPENESAVHDFLLAQGVDWETYLKTGRDQPFIAALSDSWTGAMPATFVYDRRGGQVGNWEGAVEFSKFEEYAQRAIVERE